jgi:hypothetical protein
LLSLGSAFLLMGHTPYRQWQVYRKKRLIVVASQVDEVALRVGASIVDALAARLPQSKAMLATTATGADIVSLLTSAQLDVALLTSDDAYEALRGAGRFKEAVPLRALAVLGSSLLHLVTLERNGISRVVDLKGKVLASGPPLSPTERLAVRVLEASGLDPDRDLRREPLAGEQAAAALRAKKVDAIARVDVVAGGALQDVVTAQRPPIALLAHDETLPTIEARYGPVYRRGTIPRGAYPGLASDVGAIAVAHLLVCRDDFLEDKAYQIAKALAEHRDEDTRDPVLPFHPGARRFRDEGASR